VDNDKIQQKSLWVRDVSVETEVGKFLDSYFYSKFVDDFYRFTAKMDQLEGKDVRLTWSDLTNIIVDEKAISHYINKDIPTFAFEISSMFSGRRLEGWLFNKEKKTEYYLCIWIWAKNSWNPSCEDIIKLDCLLIKRSTIIDYLVDEGFTKERILQIEDEARAVGLSGPIDKGRHRYVYFYNTTRLAENPFNVIIRKEKLRELARKHIIVTKEGCDILP
jgi:hypothetical protein